MFNHICACAIISHKKSNFKPLRKPMNIGDKVRLVHGKEQGIVKKIVSDK